MEEWPMVPIDVYLRDTVTGDTRTFTTESSGKDNDSLLFIWVDGNYSCDCNRSLFLWNWNDEKELDCSGPDNRIVIDKIVRLDTNEVIGEDL